MKKIEKFMKKIFNKLIKCLAILIAFVFSGEMLLFAEEKIEVFPTVPYDQFIIYQNLILFWIGIIGLIIIIKMKLKELKRIQDMGIDKEEKDIPFLD